MDRRRVSWLWALALALLAACQTADPATEVLVVVDSDLKAGSELTKLKVQLFDDDDDAPRKHDFTIVGAASGRANEYTLPLSYSLTPGASGALSFRLLVTGRGRGADNKESDVVEYQAIAKFTHGVRTRLDVFLARACLGELCRQDNGAPGSKTCSAGACTAIPTRQLPSAGVGEFGGFTASSRPLDAGHSDARARPQAETGPSPQCSEDGDCEAKLSDVEPAGCALAKCNAGSCTYTTVDADGDTHATASCAIKSYPIQLGDDCDDSDATRFPGAWDGPEVEGEHADTCNARDEDCDGELDEERHEGKSCMCDPVADVQVDCSFRADNSPISWPAGTPVGACQYGKRSCKDGAWGKCTGAIEPKPKDTCQPDDDSDCDGQRNEDCACVDGERRACGTDVGACQAGTQTCSAAKWSATCVGAVMPMAQDTCDMGNDNNCNDKPNEGCACINQTTSTCGKVLMAKGVCANRAVTCKAGKWDTAACPAVDVEVCTDNGQDEDCDGQVNEAPTCQCTNGKTALCGIVHLGTLGSCAGGRSTCVNGRWGACDTTPAGRDTCSPLAGDENCNGAYNEGCTCVAFDTQSCSVGECGGGMQTCNSAGEWGSCTGASCPDAGV